MPKYFGHEYEVGQRAKTIALITEVLRNAENTPLGVNEIARRLDKPVSTIHVVLKDRSSPFVQDKNKKWRLPDTFEDLWAENRIEELRKNTDLLFDGQGWLNAIKAVENGEFTRTQLLMFYKGLREYLYDLTRMVEFIENTTTKALIQNKK